MPCRNCVARRFLLPAAAALAAVVPHALHAFSPDAAAVNPFIEQARLQLPVSYPSNELFGTAVALSGNTALVSNSLNDKGKVSVYTFDGSAWHFQTEIVSPNPNPGQNFGFALALDGDTALITALGQYVGTVYVFVRNGTVWSQQAKLSDNVYLGRFGISVSLVGDTALIGDPDVSLVYVYARNGNSWTQETELSVGTPDTRSGFGSVLAFDGATALIGAPSSEVPSGAAYVFIRSGAVWTEQAKLTYPISVAEFGTAVALNGDTAVIGVPNALSYAGTAFIFTRTGVTWSQGVELSPFATGFDSSFGYAVAVSGGEVLISAPYTHQHFGSVFAYTRTDSGWTQQAELLPADTATASLFGASLSFNGVAALIGNWVDTAYIFTTLHPTAALAVNVQAAWPLTPITISGTGFAPGEAVLLRYARATGANTYPMQSVHADNAGAFSLGTEVPFVSYGSGVIEAAGQTSGQFGAVNFNIEQHLAVSPDSASPGGAFQIEGVGFPSNTKLAVFWDDPNSYLGSVTTDNTGSFRDETALTATVPAAAAPGPHHIHGLTGGSGNAAVFIGVAQISVQ